MEQKIYTEAEKEFNKRLEQLSNQELPALFSNNKPFVVIYERLLVIEKKLNELKNKELKHFNN